MNSLTNPFTRDEEGKLKVFSISGISDLIKNVLEGTIGTVKVKGEITGLKKHSSGHYYFDLKEQVGGKSFVIKSVVWKWTRLSMEPEEGMEVICSGKITSYAGMSNYQITVESMEIAGEGALLKMLEERKKKLAAEGLFDEDRKKPIPYLPKIIGVVTSPTGAVFSDIIHRISDRFPVRVILWPSAVQGDGADKTITAGIDGFNKMTKEQGKPDVIIVARGGGSLQDLLPYCEENVLRAVAGSNIPVISAVGHETDTMLIDYVSDKRAPTPTGAAEIAVPVKMDLIRNISNQNLRMINAVNQSLEQKKLRLDGMVRAIKNPMQVIEDFSQRIDDKVSFLTNMVNTKISSISDKLQGYGKLLESYSFKNVLKRGYSIVWNDGNIVSNTSGAKASGNVDIEFYDGKIGAVISGAPTSTSVKEVKSEVKPVAKPKPKKTSENQGDLF